jgi:hypothetical protein
MDSSIAQQRTAQLLIHVSVTATSTQSKWLTPSPSPLLLLLLLLLCSFDREHTPCCRRHSGSLKQSSVGALYAV